MPNETNGRGRIEALRQKEKAIRAAIAKEQVKRKKREFRDFERLKAVIGGALLASASEDANFAAHLRERLQKCSMVESDGAFLRAKGWV